MLGDQTSAIQSARQALRIHRDAGAALEELKDLVTISEAAQSFSDTSLARSSLASARSLADRLAVPSARVEVALAEARLAMKGAAPRRVHEILRVASIDLSAIGAGAEWQAHDLAAEAWLALGHNDSAIAQARLAVASVERVRGRLSDGSQRSGFLAERLKAYARLIDALLLTGQPERAFAVADLMRGRALRDHLASSAGDAVSPGIGRLAGEDSLLRRISALEHRVEQFDADAVEGGIPSDGDARARLQAELEEARRAIGAWSRKKGQGRAESRILHMDILDPRLVQRNLALDEAVVSFAVTESKTHLFVVRRQTLSHFTLAIGERALAPRIRLARDLAARPRTGPDPPIFTALDSLLFTGARADGALRGVRHLILVPHGSLAYLPFAALREAGSGRYLAEMMVISIVPSAAALSELRRRPRQTDSLASVTVFAPEPDALPASRWEADAIRSRFGGARVHLASSATEAAVIRALSGQGIVHIASHATMNSANPLYSRIDLTVRSGSDTLEDGRLHVHEMLKLAVQSPLVFLSGCETGVGSAWSTAYRAGEDFTTLGLALLYAGAGAVVATLWPINDESAGVFALRFYTHLLQNSPAHALALAQRDFINDPRYRAPYHWAAYRLIGAQALSPTR